MVTEAALVLYDLKKAVFILDFFMTSLTDRASASFEANMIRLGISNEKWFFIPVSYLSAFLSNGQKYFLLEKLKSRTAQK